LRKVIRAISRHVHSVTGRQDRSDFSWGPPVVPSTPMDSGFWMDAENTFVRL